MPDEMSAEELVLIVEQALQEAMENRDGVSPYSVAAEHIEADRARQREIGRAEMRSEIITACADNVIELGNRYAAVVKAGIDVSLWLETLAAEIETNLVGRPEIILTIDKCTSAIDKALADLDEAKGVRP